jgi:hypothetical protein
MKIDRHNIDQTFLDELSQRIGKYLEIAKNSSQFARQNPKNLDSMMDDGRRAAAYGLAVGSPMQTIKDCLRIGARGAAGLFAAAAASPSNPVTVSLDDGPPATYTSPPDESTVNLGRWITGFYLGIIAGDKDSINELLSVDLASLRKSSTTGPEYLYLYAKSLQDYRTMQWTDIVKTMLAAVKATAPERPDISDKDWALDLHVPQLEVLIYLVTKDAKFGPALAKAVELHKKYWSKKKDLRLRDYKGFLAVELTGLAKMGLQQGLTFDVDSPYIPMELIRS